jgi:hypothetical protein
MATTRRKTVAAFVLMRRQPNEAKLARSPLSKDNQYAFRYSKIEPIRAKLAPWLKEESIMSGSSHSPQNAGQQNLRRARRDLLTAQHIDLAIAIQRCISTYAAAQYLSAKKVEISLVCRTLTQPLNRRTYRDWNYSNHRATGD